MLIYTPKLTSRIQYTFKLFFEAWDCSFELTNSEEDFMAFEGPKLNYSMRQFQDELFIELYGLLNEKGIVDQEVNVSQWNNMPIFFKSSNSGVLPFDVFSASFFLVSRYEEYLPHKRDKHQRFIATESVAYQNQFLHIPIINFWQKALKEAIQKKFPDLKLASSNFRFISTIDIDNAFYYKEKGFARTLASFFRSAIHMDVEGIKKRWKVITNRLADPNDTYDLQLELQKKYNLEVLYFILLGDYDVNDKNISHNNRSFQLIIKHLSDHAKIGIHPSYASNSDINKLEIEFNRLQTILKREIVDSRQHFLKLQLPSTYRKLIELGIQNDYTMGYADQLGFRASICSSFNFYDLEEEQETKLKIHPFCVMDATLKYYIRTHPSSALDHINSILKQVKAVNGTFISLWHNETFSDYKEWEGWKELYEQMIQSVKELSNQ